MLCLLTEENDNPIIIRPHNVFTDTQYVVVLWLGFRCCRPSVNTICGRIMIELSLLSSISKHNMWSCYDWVVVVVFRLLTQHVVILWLGCRCCPPSVNTICGGIMIGLSLSSVSKHNMWSCYDWVVVVFVSKHYMWSCYDWVVVVVRQPNHNTTKYCVNRQKTTTTTQS
jgi:hypothetical protein